MQGNTQDQTLKGMIEWLTYIDSAGYIDYEQFLKLPNFLINNIIAIRTAEALKRYKVELTKTKDLKIRKTIRDNINELEEFFDE